jgi:hypothetical protein
MAKDITSLFSIGDLVNVVLKKRMTTSCMGSETHLMSDCDSSKEFVVNSVMGEYVGAKPGLIKIRPIDGRLLDSPPDISRYVVIAQTQIKEAYKYKQPVRVFP